MNEEKIKGKRLYQILQAYSADNGYPTKKQCQILGVLKDNRWPPPHDWLSLMCKNGISRTTIRKYIEYSCLNYTDIICNRIIAGKMVYKKNGRIVTLLFTEELSV